MAVRIQFRRGTSSEWSSANPVLAEGELGFESDTKIIKFGDGATAWDSLPVAAAGDITAVIAGTGLTGGATSGQATLDIDSSYVVTAAAIDAAGDLIVGAGPDTYARLPIGANGSVLVADSTQSVGVRWAAASSSGGAVVPTGTILPFAGDRLAGVLLSSATELPGGFLLCDGAPISRSTYSDLFAAIGTAYTTTTNPAQFNLPDFRTRVPSGFSSGDTNFGVLGARKGDVETVLVGGTPSSGSNQVQLPSHSHGITFTGQGSHPHNTSTEIQDASHTHGGSATGGGHTHQIPYFRNNYSANASSAVGVVGTAGTVTAATTGTGTHSHSVSLGNEDNNHRHTVNITESGGHSHEANITSSLPSSATLSRIQPSLVVNYIIKY